jgi:hypothetical protein
MYQDDQQKSGNTSFKPDPPEPSPEAVPTNSPLLMIELHQSDVRSRDFACNLVVENRGQSPITIRSIVPSFCEGVTPLEVKKLTDYKTQCSLKVIASLCTICLRDPAASAASSTGKRQPRFWSRFREWMGWPLSDIQSAVLPTVADARRLFDSCIAPLLQGGCSERAALAATIKAQIEALEKPLHRPPSDTDQELGVVTPGSSCSFKYLFNGKRGFLDSKDYVVTFNCIYEDQGFNGKSPSSKRRNIQCCKSTAITITPFPLLLSTVAMFFAPLGVLVDNIAETWKTPESRATEPVSQLPNLDGVAQAIAKAVPDQPEMIEAWNRFLASEHISATLGNNLLTHGLVAIVIAFVLFNAYEFTSLGQNLTARVSWRSALAIGFSTGLLHEKILDVLNTLLVF